MVEQRFAGAMPYRTAPHGDCRLAMSWTKAGPHFVDLDDCMTGPAVRTCGCCCRGDRRVTHSWPTCSRLWRVCGLRLNRLIEPLRTLRIMHYAGWLARRWEDPAFPRAFPWFQEPKFWEEHVLNLREQLAAMEEESLRP
jgi:Ser/Thr protein kinase RdoA (MazF antagonist)